MTRSGTAIRLLAGSLAAAAVGTALADVDLTLGNGDKVASALAAGGEVETFRFTCPAGALVSVRAKVAKKGPPLRVRALDPALAALGEGTGPAASVVKAVAPATGVYTAEVSAADGAAGASYSVTVTWKSPKKFGTAPTLAPGGQAQVAFSAEAGATASFTVKKGRGSAALPVVLALSGPGGDLPLAPGAAATVAIPVTGDYTLTFGDAGDAGGAVVAAVKVKPPKAAKRTANIGTSGVPPGTRLDATRVIGPPGGTLAADPDGPIAGASVTIPPGALGEPTSVLIGSTTVIVTPAPGLAAGPSIFLGPEGLSFAPALAQVTIPYDSAYFPDGTSGLRVYTRTDDGDVVEITGLTIDAAAATVTFAVSHFSSFQVRRAFPLVERSHLVESPRDDSDDLGYSVAVDGDVAAVGAVSRDPDGLHGNAGEVATYVRGVDGTWTQGPRVVAPDLAASNGFGWSCALSGSRLVVGAPFSTAASGNVTSGVGYAYARDAAGNWQFETEFLPTGPDIYGYQFGTSAAVDGDTAVFGAPIDSNDVSLGGAAYVFVRDASSWTLQQRLAADTPVGSELFGTTVAIAGDTAVVGTEPSNDLFVVYVFRRTGTTWTQVGRIETPLGEYGDEFGTALSISAGRIAVGAPRGGTFDAGIVYVFRDEGTAFPLETTLLPVDPTSESYVDRFGTSLVLRQGVLVVGAPLTDIIDPQSSSPSNAGQVLVYEAGPSAGQWLLAARLRGTGADAFPIGTGDAFGSAVAFDGQSIVVGAPHEGDTDTGAAYAFDVR